MLVKSIFDWGASHFKRDETNASSLVLTHCRSSPQESHLLYNSLKGPVPKLRGQEVCCNALIHGLYNVSEEDALELSALLELYQEMRTAHSRVKLLEWQWHWDDKAFFLSLMQKTSSSNSIS